jgi:hypothetical protein
MCVYGGSLTPWSDVQASVLGKAASQVVMEEVLSLTGTCFLCPVKLGVAMVCTGRWDAVHTVCEGVLVCTVGCHVFGFCQGSWKGSPGQLPF